MRPIPEITPANEWFWRSGQDGRLRIQACQDCATLVPLDEVALINEVVRRKTWYTPSSAPPGVLGEGP